MPLVRRMHRTSNRQLFNSSLKVPALPRPPRYLDNCAVTAKCGKKTGVMYLMAIVTLLSCLISCSTLNTAESKKEWLERNYPNRALHLDHLATAQEFFREDVLAGNIQFGMTVDEVLIASDTAPYGPHRYQGKFWCDNQAVQRCDNTCKNCEGTVLLKNQVILFMGTAVGTANGNWKPAVVVEIYDKSTRQSLFHAPPSHKYQVAEALYYNKIIMGMTIHDVHRVLQQLSSRANYYCGKASSAAHDNCNASCGNCRIEINARDKSKVMLKSIYLEPRQGIPTVTHIDY